jgi:hypothetical protein
LAQLITVFVIIRFLLASLGTSRALSNLTGRKNFSTSFEKKKKAMLKLLKIAN